MSFGTDYMQTTSFNDVSMEILPFRFYLFSPGDFIFWYFHQIDFKITPKHDVGSPACHISGDSHSTGHACVSDNLGFTLMLLGI